MPLRLSVALSRSLRLELPTKTVLVALLMNLRDNVSHGNVYRRVFESLTSSG